MGSFTLFHEKKRTRVSLFVFSGLSLLIAGIAQFYSATHGGGLTLTDVFLYAPALCLIFAGAFRSYLLYLLSTIFAFAHEICCLIALVEAGGSLLDIFSACALLSLIAALAWQVILFYRGHADMSALTNTTILCVILSLFLVLAPYVLFPSTGFHFSDAWHITILTITWLCFANGIEPVTDDPDDAEPPTEPLDV